MIPNLSQESAAAINAQLRQETYDNMRLAGILGGQLTPEVRELGVCRSTLPNNCAVPSCVIVLGEHWSGAVPGRYPKVTDDVDDDVWLVGLVQSRLHGVVIPLEESLTDRATQRRRHLLPSFDRGSARIILQCMTDVPKAARTCNDQ